MLIEIYNPEWVNQFEKIKEKLMIVLSGIDVNIEHIGSTSIPSLAAKPIIDIDIVYNESLDFELIKKNLEGLGYFHNGNQDVEGREVFKRTGKTENEVLDKISHHLYVCKHDCAELQRHLLFRDYLRKRKVTRNFYQKLKYQIAKEASQDKKQYANLKELKATSFVNYVIELAQLENDKFGKIYRINTKKK
jgi:GrpB-like predicted nucleotidyltransferase (UPF0157 family)